MFTKKFNEISKDDANVAGGKGASLGEMTRAGLPVPVGFVVTAECFDKFLQETDLNVEIESIFSKINQHDIASIERASEKIQALILNADVPDDIKKEIESSFKDLNAEFVAVRSSATAEDSSAASWAGELESYLNTTGDTLLEAVKKCWASLFTPRAIFYRFEKEMHNQRVSVAVVVQKMIQSEVSGIAFTVHPVTEDYNQMVIEAGYGLGEAIVGGMITPDTYVVNKSKVESQKSEAIEDKNISKQEMKIVKGGFGNKENVVELSKQELQKISDDQIVELSKICIAIEKHYDFPCDIEWAYENRKFYIVQSRPITTLTIRKESSVEPFEKTKKDILLSKFYTREYSLLYACVWREANCRRNSEWLETNIDEILFLRPNISDNLEVWFSVAALDSFRVEILSKFSADAGWFDKVCKAFTDNWNYLFPYFSREEALSIEEFKDFYGHWIEWWTPMAIVMQIPEIQSLPEKVRDIAYDLRAESQEYSDMGDEIYFKCLRKFFPEMSDYAFVLTPEELFSQNFPSNSILEERKNGWLMLNDKFSLINELDKNLKIRNFQLEKLNLDSNILKGQTANAGKISGKVKIISSVDQLIEIEQGDILVTIMTDPRYVPVLKKTAAIITDEGGITCHAAIVARELNIPCVIGTKAATQILKDGDIVEVDANNGVIHIIK